MANPFDWLSGYLLRLEAEPVVTRQVDAFAPARRLILDPAASVTLLSST